MAAMSGAVEGKYGDMNTQALHTRVARSWSIVAMLAALSGTFWATPALGQVSGCMADVNRHAQLSEQDASQLYDLQMQHGFRKVTRRTTQIFDRLVDAQQEADAASW